MCHVGSELGVREVQVWSGLGSRVRRSSLRGCLKASSLGARGFRGLGLRGGIHGQGLVVWRLQPWKSGFGVKGIKVWGPEMQQLELLRAEMSYFSMQIFPFLWTECSF